MQMENNKSKVEWGVAYPNIVGGEIDRFLPMPDKVYAEMQVNNWKKVGVDSYVVSRVISKWMREDGSNDYDSSGLYEKSDNS